jgi:SAM-dependent methyltransferase
MTQSRPCPVCKTDYSKARLVVAENIDPKKISGLSFASRKEPEFMCHRLVECPECGLVYADQPPDEEMLALSYHAADYDSSEEADDAARSYSEVIAVTLEALERRDNALEIGTGTGVFLEYLAKAGFAKVEGVEPSSKAIAAAPLHRQSWIREGMFDENDYEPESFDLICCFMTMEHVRNPLAVAEAVFRLLRPGGVFVTVTHDCKGWLNRMLGKRSPIIDFEHMQLFSEPSIRYLFKTAGFANVSTSTFANQYTLRYWLRLCSFPGFIKRVILAFVSALSLTNRKISLNVGNSFSAGFKPARGKPADA